MKPPSYTGTPALWIGFACASVPSMLALMTELAARAGVPAATVVRAKKIEFGDIQINAAMQLAKAEKKPPREIGQRIADAIADHPAVAKAEVAGPGFVNIFVSDAWLADHADRRAGAARRRRRPAGGHRLFVAERGQADAHRPHPLDDHRRRHQAGAARGRLRGGRRQPPGRLGHAVRQADRRLAQVARRGGVRPRSRRRAAPPLHQVPGGVEGQGGRRARRGHPARQGGARRAGQAAAGRRGEPARCGRSSSTCR